MLALAVQFEHLLSVKRAAYTVVLRITAVADPLDSSKAHVKLPLKNSENGPCGNMDPALLAYLLFDCFGRPHALLGSNLLGNKRDHCLILLSLSHLFLLLLDDAFALFFRQVLHQVSYYLHFDPKALSYFLLRQCTP